MASEYPFRRIIGVELLAELNKVAQQNIARYRSQRQKCSAIESHAGDARAFEFPTKPSCFTCSILFQNMCCARC